MKLARCIAVAALAVGLAGQAFATEVGSYPNASALVGTERFLADQGGSYPCTACTVNPTAAQIAAYVESLYGAVDSCSTAGNFAYYASAGTAVTCQSPAAVQAAIIAANAKTYSPTIGAGATNDWDPSAGTGITTVGLVNATPNAAGSLLDGVLAGSDKQQFILCNATAAPASPYSATTSYIVLENQSSNDSTAANRLLMAGNAVLGPQMCATLTYIAGLVDRWLVSPVSNSRVPPTDPLGTVASPITLSCTFWRTGATLSSGTALTVDVPTDCTPQDGQQLQFDVTASTTGAIAYTWGTGFYASSTLPLPTTGGAASKQDRFLFEWSPSKDGWVLMAYNLGF